MITSPGLSMLQPPLVQAIFNRNAEEVQLLLHKKEDVNALVCDCIMQSGFINGPLKYQLTSIVQ